MDKNSNKLFTDFPEISTSTWESKILEDLKGADYAKKLIWKTNEGFDIKPYYRAEDLSALSHMDGEPGQYPFVRGNETTMNHWEVRQDIYTEDPKDANFHALNALRRGANSICFQVSKIKTTRHLETLMKGICMGDCTLHFAGAQCYPDIVNLLSEFTRKHHMNKAAIRGSFDFDPISYLLLEGDFWKSEESDMEQVGTMIGLGKDLLPSMKMITVNGQYFQNSGSNLVQELAFSLASGNEYLARATESGYTIDEVAPKITFAFAIGSNYFMEIAKLRAARMLWARIVEQYKPVSESSMAMHIHSSTSNFNKSLYDPHVNILRSTTEAMSAVIGGTQSLNITPFDAFYKEPDEFSTRIARNQQIILKEESYLEKVVDPAAGSYYIESLTDSVAKAAWDLFRIVENKGGMIAAVKEGFIQDEINKQAARFSEDVATRKLVVLGTNQYPDPKGMILDKIQESQDNSTEEEEKNSKYKKLEIRRLTDDFDEMRLATEIHVEAGNKLPSVFLFTIGNLAMRKARAMFSTNFFGCAGYEIIDNPGFNNVDEGVKAALASKASIIVLCSSDEEYAELAPSIASQLKSSHKDLIVILAGYPKELVESLQASGVDDFIHIRTNVLEFLQKIQDKLNISL
ncbi:MAG: acyl-CoA mutase large subunit family protein [Bacteroidales bacterium]|nr:acyl-CoA mutase large subunit family protein [Bacteroidales bacterium]